MKNNTKKIINIAFITLFVSILLLCLFSSFLSQKDINTYENRNAYTFSRFSLKEYLSGSFQDRFELFLTDQIPYSFTIKKLFNDFSSSKYVKLLKTAVNASPSGFIHYDGLIYHDGYVLYEPISFVDSMPIVNSKLDIINRSVLNNPDIDFFVYYIESDSIIDFESDEKIPLFDYLKTNLDSNCVLSGFEVSSFSDYSKYFYKNDHHWNNAGAYKGYCDILTMLGDESLIMKPTQIIETSVPMLEIKSPYASYLDSRYSDYADVYIFDFPEPVNLTYSGNFNFYAENPATPFYYGFYGENFGEFSFDSKQSGRPNALIIGDSFDNAILQLLACNFNKTYSVDLRYYSQETGEVFSLSNYIDSHDIDEVIFIGSQTLFAGDDFLMVD